MAEISYICRRTVVSTKPVQAGKRHPLSGLDRAMEQRRIRIVLYYRTPPDKEMGEATTRLRESISETLSSFPMVTGRLQRKEEGEEWEVKCNDAGVRMVEAIAKGSVEDWLNSVEREMELDKLLHWEDISFHKFYFWSTFYVQLTEFEEGGIAIGFSCTHLLADPISATMIIKAWANTSLLAQEIPIKPLLNTINHKPPLQKSLTPRTNTKYTTIALLFTTHMVESCMKMAKPNTDHNPILPSPFQALAGLFWTCISNVKGLREGLMEMSICLDVRKLLGLEEGYFGNFMLHNAVHGEGLSGHKISEAAMAVRGVMEKMDKEEVMDFIRLLDCKRSLFSGCDDHHHQLICTNLEDLESYSVVFEAGYPPARVSYHVEPVAVEGRVLVLPAPPEEGPLSRVAMVTLPEDEAVKLCEDALILSFSPTILMGFNKN